MTRTHRCFRLRWLTAAVATLALAGCALDASDEPHDEPLDELGQVEQAATTSPRAPYSTWTFGANGLWNVDIPMTVATDPGPVSWYWSTMFYFPGASDYHMEGYLGLQPFGPTRADGGTHGKMVLFNIWSATGGSPGAGAFCQPTYEFQPGYRCILPYEWQSGHSYRLRIWKVGAEDWLAAIADATTGAEQTVGTLHVPGSSGGLNGTLQNFSEWYGSAGSSCWAYPYSAVVFGRPRANGDGLSGNLVSTSLGSQSACDSTFITRGENGVVHEVAGHNAAILWRYWNGTGGDHFYTRTRNDAGYAYYGYSFERSEGIVFTSQLRDTVPLYRMWLGGSVDHFYTTSYGEMVNAQSYGYVLEGVEGYVYPAGGFSDRTPVYRYWNPYNVDHYYTTSWMPSGTYGYGYEWVSWYTP